MKLKNSKTQIMMKLKKSNSYEIKNSNCEETQKLLGFNLPLILLNCTYLYYFINTVHNNNVCCAISTQVLGSLFQGFSSHRCSELAQTLPCILKQVGLDKSGQRLISLNKNIKKILLLFLYSSFKCFLLSFLLSKT